MLHFNNDVINTINEAISKNSLASIDDIIDEAMWNSYYKSLYEPLEALWGSEIVLQQFRRDKYLIIQNLQQSQLKNEKNSFDSSLLGKDKPIILTRAQVLRAPEGLGGYTPLHEAANNTYNALSECYAILTSPFCTSELINAPAKTSWTALCMAIRNRDHQLVRLLCQYGAKVNNVQTTDGTPLHIAVINKQLRSLKVLLAHGAELEQTNKKGYTPLHLAVERGSVAIAKFLFEMGADPYKKTIDGKTVLDLIDPQQASEFGFLNHEKPEIELDNPKAMACFICVSAIRTYPKDNAAEVERVFKQLHQSSHFSLLHEVCSILPEEYRNNLMNLLSGLKKKHGVVENNETSLTGVQQPQLEDDLSAHFICPLLSKIMNDPVILPDGYSYERCAAEEWLTQSNTSPITGEEFVTKCEPIPNLVLKKIIENVKNKQMSEQRIQATGRRASEYNSRHSLFKSAARESKLKPSCQLTSKQHTLHNKLIEACRNADLNKVKEYIEVHHVNPLITNQKGQYALGEAIWHLAPHVVSYLLAQHDYSSEDLRTILEGITRFYNVNTVFPMPFEIKTFNDWYKHSISGYTPWLYDYDALKKRETASCPVYWNSAAHVLKVALPPFSLPTTPFIQVNVNQRKVEVFGGNDIYEEYSHPIKWLKKQCQELVVLLNNHEATIADNYTLTSNTHSLQSKMD